MPRRARILLVDDRRENLIALEAALAPVDATMVPVRSGEQALAELGGEEFAVILLDVLMPGMDGFETASRIKARAALRDVPIIFLTAAPERPEHSFRGYAAGAVDYLAKPFDPRVLQAKVSVFIDLYLARRRLREQAETLSGRLRAVETAAAALAALPVVRRDAVAAAAAAALGRRLGQLREAMDSQPASGA